MSKQKQKTICVHNIFWTCTYWTGKSMDNLLSYCVRWCKRKSFWQRFTCTEKAQFILTDQWVGITDPQHMKVYVTISLEIPDELWSQNPYFYGQIKDTASKAIFGIMMVFGTEGCPIED